MTRGQSADKFEAQRDSHNLIVAPTPFGEHTDWRSLFPIHPCRFERLAQSAAAELAAMQITRRMLTRTMERPRHTRGTDQP
jgi:hypothetical protein